MTKRRIITQLPAVNQTEPLKKFFASTVDELFQPGEPERLSGYIGTVPSYFNAETDFYISEPTNERIAHQLEPAMVSQDQVGNINNLLFYDDFINYLGLNNGVTTDHNRLFSDTCYAWAPPVDIDKLNNPHQYYWFGGNISALPSVTLTAPSLAFTGDGVTTTFALPPQFENVDPALESIVVFVDLKRVQFFKQGADAIGLYEAPPANASVIVFRYGDLYSMIAGQKSFDASPFTDAPVTSLTSTMKVILRDAQTMLTGWSGQPWAQAQAIDGDHLDMPWCGQNNNLTYWCDGVGSSITLIPIDADIVPLERPIHVTIDRRSRDANIWSKNNFWVHEAAFSWSGQSFPTYKAKRPIIEFLPNLEIFDYGTQRLPDINATLTGEPIWLNSPYRRKVNDPARQWDVASYDREGFEPSLLKSIPLAEANGKALNSVFVDAQHPLVFGDRLLVLSNDNPDLANRIITVVKDHETGMMLFEASPPPSKGDIVRLTNSMISWGSTPFAAEIGSSWNTEKTPIEFYFDGEKWVEAANQSLANDPLFMLYTNDYVPHDALPSNTFAGNRLFGFVPGSGPADPVLARALSYDGNGDIQFSNDIATARATSNGVDIPGFQYFRQVGGEASDFYGNGWYHKDELTQQTSDSNGIWTLPNNLVSNAGNEDVGIISRGNWFEHLNRNIADAPGFSGSSYGASSWRDTERPLGLGSSILQNRSPLLKAMLCASDKRFDYFDAVRYAEQAYNRFKAAFIQQITIVLNLGLLFETSDPETWVSTILERMKLAKTTTFPFALSTMAGGNYFIPPTPHALGLFAPSKPEIVVDKTYSAPVTLIVGHDRSRLPAFGDYRDAIILALETRIYANINPDFRTEDTFVFPYDKYIGGRYRDKTKTYYAANEVVQMYQPIFVRWAQTNKLNFNTNSGFEQTDPFTYNYRGVRDFEGVEMPGHWRAIYRYYFDTDRPHEAPWEMLGFATRPAWWLNQYGPAPYTSGNLPLWRDLRDGLVRQGPRAGVHTAYARPDLLTVLPVDANGNLLDPVACGIIPNAPPAYQAMRDWVIGDQGPVENLWMSTSGYGFAKAQVAALMRPAELMEFGWDRAALGFANGQWINKTTKNRQQPKDVYVHGEVIDGVTVTVTGIQQWISDLMASRSQDVAIFGAAVRGLTASLSHRMAGFTQGANLSVTADNIGVIPSENTKIVLYNPPPFHETFYSAVIIEWVGSGWRVVGYDAQTQAFATIPGDTNGPKSTVRIGETTVIHEWKPNVYYAVGATVSHANIAYTCIVANTSGNTFEAEYWAASVAPLSKQIGVEVCDNGQDVVASVPYGTIITTYQGVATFLRDYFRWMESEGFKFDEPDENGDINNWYSCIVKFLEWTQVSWSPGNFIALSPLATTLKFSTPFGTIHNIEDEMNGVYGLLDRTGRPIRHNDAFVSRIDGDVTVLVNNNDLFGARLRIGAVEHALVFSNTTVFGDILYAPLLSLWQPRLNMIGIRAANWVGRRSAPGYIVESDDLLENFERTSEDIRNMFDIEKADVPVLRDHARHVLGFQDMPYLDALFVSPTEQFEFYQGMCQQKGAPGVFSALTRSSFIDQNADLRFLEEWALELGAYGALRKTTDVSFSFTTADVRYNRQLVVLGEVHVNDGVIGLSANDARWIDQPSTPNVFRTVRQGLEPLQTPLPSAGYVGVDEITYTVMNMSLLDTLFFQVGGLYNGDTVWTYDRNDGSFDVLCAMTLGPSGILVTSIETANEDQSLDVNMVRFTFDRRHDFLREDNGLYVAVPSSPSYTKPNLGGVQRIYYESAYSVLLDVSVTDPDELAGSSLSAPVSLPIYVLRPMRFPNRAAAHTFWQRFFPTLGQRIWVDDDGAGRWIVYQWTDAGWAVARQQPAKIDPSFINSSRIYNNATEISLGVLSLEQNPVVAPTLTVLNPIAGYIPGSAKKELDFITDHDPASYYGGDIWGRNQIGRLWWDTSTARFLEPEIDILDSNDPARNQRSRDYRVKYWGRLAPGASVNVYEWTRFMTWPPTETTGDNYIEKIEFDPETGAYVYAYYAWVLAPTTLPNVPFRSVSAATVASVIVDPASNGVPWIAPILPNGMLVSGIEQYINEDTSALNLRLSAPEKTGVVHRQWQIVRPKDEITIPDFMFWRALRSSLVGYDDVLAAVPDSTLPANMSIGIGPGQTMFESAHLLMARRAFVQTVNAILAKHDFVDENPDFLKSLFQKSDTFAQLIWNRPDESNGITPPPANSWDLRAQSIEERNHMLMRRDLLTSPAIISLNRPPRILVENLTSSLPSWSIWDVDVGRLPPPEGFDVTPLDSYEYDFRTDLSQEGKALSISKNYDLAVASYADLIAGEYAVGKRILVKNDETISGFWAVYAYLPTSAISNANGFIRVCIQTYDTADFLKRVDWYANGYSANNPPSVTYATLAARTLDVTSTATLAKVLDDGSGNWIWTERNGDNWNIVARENGSVALSDKFFDPTRINWGVTDLRPALIPQRAGILELRVLFDLFYRDLSASELNTIYFTMLHFAHAHMDQVQWAFKTSFLSIAYYRELLSTAPIASPNNIDNLVEYVNTTKPYRVKVREYIRSLATNIDQANMSATDFDKPVYYDEARGKYRVLDPSNTTDLAIMQHSPSWSQWLNNYTSTDYDPTSRWFNPVRRIHTKVRFDRIDGFTPLSRGYGFDETPFEKFAFDDYLVEVDENNVSALNRMLLFYAPTLGERAKDASIDFELGFHGVIATDVAGHDDAIYDAESANAVIETAPLGLAAPHVDAGHPQELAKTRAPDSMSMTVCSEWTAGAPRQKNMTLDADGHGPAIIPLGLVPASAESVMVFADGKILPSSAYTVAPFEQTVETTSGSFLMAHTFGTAGRSVILSQKYFTGDGSTTTFDIGVEAAYAEVAINGAITPASVAGTKVTLSPAPAADSDVLITGYDSDCATRIVRRALSYNSAKTWTLTPSPTDGVMVFKNGLRLSPNTMRVFNAAVERSVAFVASAPADLRVRINGTAYTGTVGIAIAGAPNYDAINMVNASAFSAPPQFVLDGTVFHVADATITGTITVEHVGDGDYLISGSDLSITAALSNTDALEAIVFENAALMGMAHQKYHGATDGRYPLYTSPHAHDDYMLVTLDGKMLVANVDYVVETPLNASPGVRLLSGGQTSDQTVVITTFSGKPASPSSMWITETLQTGVSIMGDYQMAGNWDISAFDVAEMDGLAPWQENVYAGQNVAPLFKPVFKMNGTWDFAHFDDSNMGVLSHDVFNTDTTISITMNPAARELSRFDPFALPDNAPGVISVNGERIEYFAVERDGATVTLSELRRGANSTRVGSEQRARASATADGTMTDFTLPGASAAEAVEVMVWQDNGYLYFKQTIDYTVAQSGSDVVVSFATPPKADAVVFLAQTTGMAHKAGAVVYAHKPHSVYLKNPFRGARDFAA